MAINLLPSEIRERRRYAAKNRRIVDVGSSLLFATVIGALILFAQIWLLSDHRSSVEQGLAHDKANLASFAGLEQRASADQRALAKLQQTRSKHVVWNTFFSELATHTPAGIYYTGLDIAPTGIITLTGSARDEPQISAVLKSLKSWSALSQVTIQSVSTDSDSVGFAHNRFSLQATLNTASLR